MSARARLAAAFLSVLALAPAPSLAQQITPYLDRVQPGFQLPPVPGERLDRLYPPPALPPAPPSRATPTPAPYPGGTLGGERRDYPQGFTMTIERRVAPSRPRDRSADNAGRIAIDKPREIALHIARCWSPPRARSPSEVTIRLSFTRIGAVIGVPRVTYINPGQGTDREAVRASILKAIERCAPFEFTDGLGSAISGRPFTLRFVAPARSAHI